MELFCEHSFHWQRRPHYISHNQLVLEDCMVLQSDVKAYLRTRHMSIAVSNTALIQDLRSSRIANKIHILHVQQSE